MISLLGRDLEHEIVAFVEDTGIGVLVWSPLAGGFLSGKYTRENPTPKGARLNEFKIPPIDVEQGYTVVEVLKEIAQNHGATPAQVAIAWILTKPFVSSVIIGGELPTLPQAVSVGFWYLINTVFRCSA